MAHRWTDFTPPKLNNAAELEAAVEHARTLTPREVLAISVRAGIHNPDGTLTEPYRGGESVLGLTTEREADGRWIAEIPAIRGAMAYGATEEEAVRKAKEIATEVLLERDRELMKELAKR